jgi:pimeloyl-ACP methyl ester carboxylesterase
VVRVADGTLQVDGATIHYRTAGRGPVLLLLPGGDGDAESFDLSLPDLTDRFTVVVFDRRGLSRSALEDPLQEMTIERHADDALAVLATVTDGPALVFGGSLGAVVALDLTVRHPDCVRAVVAFEPPLPTGSAHRRGDGAGSTDGRRTIRGDASVLADGRRQRHRLRARRADRLAAACRQLHLLPDARRASGLALPSRPLTPQ